jgi:hypothetical protein
VDRRAVGARHHDPRLVGQLAQVDAGALRQTVAPGQHRDETVALKDQLIEPLGNAHRRMDEGDVGRALDQRVELAPRSQFLERQLDLGVAATEFLENRGQRPAALIPAGPLVEDNVFTGNSLDAPVRGVYRQPPPKREDQLQ